MLVLKKIDYHSEEILYLIAFRDPGLVLGFFFDRFRHELITGTGKSDFEPIPYEFHKLQEPLSKDAKAAVNVVSALYDGNYGMFIFRGARLLRVIFPEFQEDLQ